MPILPMLLSNWKLVVIGLLVLAVGVQSYRLDRCKTGWHDYEVSVAALGKAQEIENERIAKEREALSKETTDAKDKAIASLSVRYADARKRVRDHARSGTVPAASEAPALASACEPVAGFAEGLGVDQAQVSSKLDALELALLEALEKADQEMVKYRALWSWAQRVQ